MRRRSKGFTLIEMAVVIAIMGLLAAGLTALLTTFLKSTRSRVAADNSAVVQQSLQRFVERYGRLPCPALPNLAPGAAGYGVEVAPPCAAIAVGATGIARGVVPWVTLGLQADQVQDGYARMFTYNVTATATQTDASTVSTMRGNMTIHTATPIALGLAPTGNQVNSCMNTIAPPAGGDDLNGCNLRSVVVLVSHGENGLGAYTSQGGQLPTPTDAAEVENTDANVSFVRGEALASGFDDLVFAWSPDDMLEPLSRQGSFRSAAAITQDRLRETAIAISNAMAAGVVAPNAYAIPAAPFPGVTMPNDGWGRPLIYAVGPTVVGGATQLCGLVSGTQAVVFTVTSLGVDGVNSLNPATNRNDDFSVSVIVDPIKAQVNNRPPAATYSC